MMSCLLLDIKLHVVLEISIIQYYADLWLQHGDEHFMFSWRLRVIGEKKKDILKCNHSQFSDVASNNLADSFRSCGHIISTFV